MIVKEELFKAVINILPVDLTKEEQRISIQLYHLLAEGNPVMPRRLADVVNMPLGRVSEILGNWIGVFYDDEKNIIGYWGIALSETRHRFIVDGKTLYTWCAWDSLFIPELLGKSAIIESTCPLTKENIHLTVWPEGVKRVSPSETVMSMVTLDQEKIGENIITGFCHFIYFFSNEEAAKQWTSKHDDTHVISLEDGVKLAQLKNNMQYRNVIENFNQ